jgi:hypothetical protein
MNISGMTLQRLHIQQSTLLHCIVFSQLLSKEDYVRATDEQYE